MIIKKQIPAFAGICFPRFVIRNPLPHLKTLIAGDDTYYTAVRFHPGRRIDLIAVAPFIDDKFTVLVEIAFIHTHQMPTGQLGGMVGDRQPAL